ncbi:MAG: FkbM family methyltransferase [Thermoplasmata archaeon]
MAQNPATWIPHPTRWQELVATGLLVIPTPERVRYLRELRRAIRNWPALLPLRLGVGGSATLKLSDGSSAAVDSQALARFLMDDPRLWRARFDNYRRSAPIVQGEGYVGMRLDPAAFPGVSGRDGGDAPDVRLWYDSDSQWVNCVDSLWVHFIAAGGAGPGLYSSVDVRQRDVVDVGANIGDSALFFAARGARHVYAFEPFPSTFRLAQRNVERSRFRDRITLLNEGCSAEDGSVTLGAESGGTLWNNLVDSEGAERIPVSSLSTIVDRFDLHDAVLKSNCEGYEYPLLLGASEATRRRFGQMTIEYHYGCSVLVRRLRADGFLVDYTRPRLFRNPFSLFGDRMLAGSLWATRARSSPELANLAR